MADKILITQKGLDELKEQLDYLVTVRRKEVIQKIEHARSLGDLSENSEYDDAREEQGKLESQIAEIKEQIKNAEIIDEESLNTKEINIGFHVKVFNRKFNREAEYDITGPTEADPMNGKLSSDSPIGAALIGANVGDVVVAHAPAGDIEFEVLEAIRL